MHVSIIIAVYNRASLIPELLDQWRKVDKATKYEYELIFSDDESSDDSVALLYACKDLPIRVLTNKHGGAGKARNHAYQYATGEIIIFTGDDIFPTNEFINEHYESYLNNGKKVATLGLIDWREGIQMNHLMKHITDIGCEQFGFVAMKPFEFVDFRHFYTSNISVSREELQNLECLFNQGFKKYGFEDIELGYRLYKNGIKILYNPNALAYHDHVYSSVDKFCNRQSSAGEELNTFKRMHPELSTEEIKVNIDEFNEKYARYVLSNKYLDVVGDVGLILIFAMKQSTKLIEKILAKRDSYSVRKICSRLYSVIFKHSMYWGLANGYDQYNFVNPYQAKRFAFRYFVFGKAQLFFDKDNHFSEHNSVIYHTAGEKAVTLKLDMYDKTIGRIRFDPLDQYCKIKLVSADVMLEDGSRNDIIFTFTNAKNNSGNYYDFSNEMDPILISDNLPAETRSIEIKYEVDYIWKKKIWNGMKKSFKIAKKIVKKCARYLLTERINKPSVQLITTVHENKRRKIWITVQGTSEEEVYFLVEKYREVCSFLPDIQIHSYECNDSEYSPYVYEITNANHAMDKNQFVNATLSLLEYDYDFIMLSDNLDYFPDLYGYSIQDATILAKRLAPFKSFQNSAAACTGKFVRIPGGNRLEQKINMLEHMPKLSSLDGSTLYIQWPREICDYNQFEIQSIEKKRPLVFVIPIFMAVGGVERNTIEVMKCLNNEYDFVVITLETHRPEQGSLFYQLTDLCLAYYDLAEISIFDRYLHMLERLKRAYRPDIIWFCNSSPWTIENASNIRRVFHDIPIIMQDVYDYKYGWIEYYNRPVVRSYDRFIAINKKIQDEFITTYGISPNAIDLIYPAINMDVIKQIAVEKFSRDDVLKKFNLDPSKEYFAFIGRFTEQKQPQKVFELAKHIVKSYEDVNFVMVGDGELSTEIMALIQKNGLENRIHRIKYIANVPEFTKAMEGLVIVSIFEGLPIVTVEAMCVGTPIFSTDVGDVSLFVNENDIGVISPDHQMETIIRSFDNFYTKLDHYKQNALQSTEKSIHLFSSQYAAELMSECFKKAAGKYEIKAVNVDGRGEAS